MSLWSELRRRHVIRVTIVYAVVGASVAQAAAVFLPGLDLPDWALTLVLALIVLGFPIAVILAWAYEISPDGIVRTLKQGEPVSSPSGRVPVGPPPSLSALEVRLPPAEPGRRSELGDRRSVAVLPLVNLSPDKENEYFSDGMTDDILTAISFIEGLKVISRTSIMQYKGTTKRVGEIARELGVGTVLEGSVRRAAGRVRIVVQLIDARTDEHLWAKTFDRELEDVFAVQSEVAESIASALKCRLTRQGSARLQSNPTDNLEAYQLVLRGRAEYLQFTEEHVRRGIEYLRRAIALDPKYALAHAHLASASFALPYWAPVSAASVEGSAREAIDRALALDPDIPDAYIARAVWRVHFEWDWSGADEDLARALRLNPNMTDAYLFKALFGEFREQREVAVEDARRAWSLDPLSMSARHRLGECLMWAGRMEEARQILQGMIQDDPSSFSAHINLAFTARFDGNVEGAVEHYERAVAAYDVPLAWMGKGTALWRLGRTAEAKRILAQLEARAKREYVSPYLLGLYYYVMGEVERAFDFFEEGAEIKDFLTLFIRQTSAFLGYQDHPRYLALAHRIWPDDFPA